MASKYKVSIKRELNFLKWLLDYNHFYVYDMGYSEMYYLYKVAKIFKKNGFPKINEDFFHFAKDHSVMRDFPFLYAHAELLGLQEGLIALYYKEIEEYIWKHIDSAWDEFMKVGSIKFEIDNSNPEFPKGILTYIVNNITAFERLLAKHYESDFYYFSGELEDSLYNTINEGDKDIEDYMRNLPNEWSYMDDNSFLMYLEDFFTDFITENKAELKRLYTFWLTTLDKNV